MKKWETPEVSNLSLDKTANEGFCPWDDTTMVLGVGNEDYTNPNKKPDKHPDWEWCTQHNRWHPNVKDDKHPIS